MNKHIKIFFLILLIIAGSCTKLTEQKFGSLSPDTYYTGEPQALSSVAGVYALLAASADIGDWWRGPEFSTDEFLAPGRASGGWFDQNSNDLVTHHYVATNATTGRAWDAIFREIGTANAVLASLQGAPNKDAIKAEIAETRALRAYGYFYAMDLFGNVPLVTVARIDPNNLPATTPRSDIYKFVETELLAAVADLPSVKNVDRIAYYPRLTKESVYTLLATLYLNAEVYTGTAAYDKVIPMCDNVINTGAYQLEANVGDNFNATFKGKYKELITSFSVDPTKTAGQNQFILYTQNGLDQLKYNLPFGPANGYSTTQAALDRYENQDNRKKLIEYGPQYYQDGVTPLKYPNGTQLNLVAVTDLVAAQDNEGYKPLKYSPLGATFSGFNANNDLVLERYANILLMKAEALFRTSGAGALALVNQVRVRSNATVLNSLALKDIEDERAREFLWEGQRRRDMIRFGTYFTGTWAFKTDVTPVTMGIFPIPPQQLSANPKLRQNPGY